MIKTNTLPTLAHGTWRNIVFATMIRNIGPAIVISNIVAPKEGTPRDDRSYHLKARDNFISGFLTGAATTPFDALVWTAVRHQEITNFHDFIAKLSISAKEIYHTPKIRSDALGKLATMAPARGVHVGMVMTGGYTARHWLMGQKEGGEERGR